MPISVQCPGCGGRFRANDTLAGKQVKCPKCSTALVVGPAAAPPAQERASAPATPPAVPAPHVPQPQAPPKVVGRSASGALLAAAGAGVLLVAMIIGGVWFFRTRNTTTDGGSVASTAPQDRDNPRGPGAPSASAKPTVGAEGAARSADDTHGAAQPFTAVPPPADLAPRDAPAAPLPAPWKVYSGENVLALQADEARGWVWFLMGQSLCRLDIKTHQLMKVAAGHGPQSLALEGDHVWVGGNGAMGGGLLMYDIPSGAPLFYKVENTMDGEKKGLQSNWVWKLTASKDEVWIYGDNFIQPWGLTRFRYREKEHTQRWSTYTDANTRSAPDVKDGLASDLITGVIPAADGGLWVFPAADVYQHFSPASKQWTNYRYLPVPSMGPPAPECFVEVKSPLHQTGRIAQHSAAFQLRGFAKDRFVVHGGFAGDTEKWGRGRQFTACLTFTPTSNDFVLFNVASTESRPGANDGLPSEPGPWCWDGDVAWIVCSVGFGASLGHYCKTTGEFTQYGPEGQGGLPRLRTIWCLAATAGDVFLGTDAGLVRFSKRQGTPKLIDSQPRAGATDVVVAGELNARFDAPLDASTVTPKSVELSVAGALVPGRVAYDAERQTITYRIDNRLPSGMDGQLVLKSLIQGANGQPIRRTCVTFTTK